MVRMVRAVLVPALLLSGCGSESSSTATGDTVEARRGLAALQQHGCGACHRIPGVPGADGIVGPPLDGLANRVYLAGVLPNSRENLIRWIREPDRIRPRTAMPNVGVSDVEAGAMAAWLLRKP